MEVAPSGTLSRTLATTTTAKVMAGPPNGGLPRTTPKVMAALPNGGLRRTAAASIFQKVTAAPPNGDPARDSKMDLFSKKFCTAIYRAMVVTQSDQLRKLDMRRRSFRLTQIIFLRGFILSTYQQFFQWCQLS